MSVNAMSLREHKWQLESAEGVLEAAGRDPAAPNGRGKWVRSDGGRMCMRSRWDGKAAPSPTR
jgi:hypothetical protein